MPSTFVPATSAPDRPPVEGGDLPSAAEGSTDNGATDKPGTAKDQQNAYQHRASLDDGLTEPHPSDASAGREPMVAENFPRPLFLLISARRD
jgi:hypothetical protein